MRTEPPSLERSYADEDCGCPVEVWVYQGILLTIHFEADGTADMYAEGGDWDRADIELAGAGRDEQRAAAFAWVDALPVEA